jgi:hypothetical protein
VMDPTASVHQMFYKSRKKVQTWQWLDKSSRKKARAIHGRSSHRDRKEEERKGSTDEEQSQEHSHHFLLYEEDSSRRIRPDRPNSQFRKLVLRFIPTIELAVASRHRTISHLLFTAEFVTKNNVTVVLHRPYFSQFARLEIKLEGRHFDTLRWSRQNRRRC